MPEFHEILSSRTNPNGFFEYVTEPDNDFAELPQYDRLRLVTANTITFSTEILGLNRLVAEEFALKTVIEVARATDPNITAESLSAILQAGVQYARSDMAERAIHLSLNPEKS